jgi:hypothetical protein
MPSELPKKMLSDPETMHVMFPIYWTGYEWKDIRTEAVSSYLGQEGALVVGELDLRDVEELKLPLFTH